MCDEPASSDAYGAPGVASADGHRFRTVETSDNVPAQIHSLYQSSKLALSSIRSSLSPVDRQFGDIVGSEGSSPAKTGSVWLLSVAARLLASRPS
jgi:hypothetical protein